MEYLQQAEQLASKVNSLEELVSAMREYLRKHLQSTSQTYSPKSILESRFTPAPVAFKISMSSCGSKTNIITDMLRHVGYEVKKIHGSIPESKDHAWLQVRNASGEWQEFDVTRPDCAVTPDHRTIVVCDEWDELFEEIAKAFI
jgi:hypothetical protein